VELFHDIPKISCPENNAQIFTGTENYFPSADGFLMPAKKDQPLAQRYIPYRCNTHDSGAKKCQKFI